MRDILENEVLEALKQPMSKHRKGKIHPRMEVHHRIGVKTLIVVYKKQKNITVIINAMWA